MHEFDLDAALASEMLRLLARAACENRDLVATPEAALKVLRGPGRDEMSAEFGASEQHAVEALVLQIFFSVFTGQKLDLHCNADGKVMAAAVESHHCTDTACCGPLPVWKDLAFKHEHHN